MNKHFKILYKLIICGFITTQIYTPITIGASTFHITPNKYPIITKTKYGITELNNISTYSINNKTYIKLRDIANAFHFKIEWDNSNKAILLSLEENDKNSLSMDLTKNNTSIEGTPTNQDIFINGNHEVLAGYNINGYTYFPIRDIASLTNLEIIWDQDSHTILIEQSNRESTKDKNGISETVDIIEYDNGKDLIFNDNNLMYIPESKQYDSIEKYIKQNIDPQFKIDDFIITEYSSTITPSIHYLDIYYYLGDYKTNFGYQLTIIQKYVKTIKCTGNRNMIENLNMDQMKIPNISNEKLWEKTLLEHQYTNCIIKGYNIIRYYDEDSSKFKADVVVNFIDPNGYEGANRHTFVL